jgi:TRAP-type uncharacterized transport system substrate-binding protein
MLDAALEHENAAYAKETEEKQATIAALKEELQRLKADVALRRRIAAKEAAAGTAAKVREYTHAESLQTGALKALQDRRAMEDSVHAQTVSFLKEQQDVRTC